MVFMPFPLFRFALPEGPGLGLDVDEGAVGAAKGKQFPAFRSIGDEGP